MRKMRKMRKMRRGRGRKDTRLSAWLPGFTRLIWREDKIEREREGGDDPLCCSYQLKKIKIKMRFKKIRLREREGVNDPLCYSYQLIEEII